ncbi:MAG: mechanosensitive ion channel [Gammaproteobacteria bacterium]|nr:mechanosensitive ion channel [Gammaproteobacteria bacterium]
MQLDSWTQSLVGAMSTLWQKIAAFIPNLIGALMVVIVGFVIARLMDTLLSKLLAKLGLDRLIQGTGVNKLLARVGIKVPTSFLIGKIVYWFVLLVFLVSALESLGLERISATLDTLALYVPKVFAAALVLVAGIWLAQLLNSVVSGAAEGVGIDYAAALGRLAQGLVIIISVSVAIGQLEIKAELLNYVIVIVLLSIGGAVALAIGFGCRDIAGQIIAGIYVRELYELGQQVTVEGVEGTIEEMGTVKTIILTAEGELVYFANRILLERHVKSRYE